MFSLWPGNLKLDDEEYVVEQNGFGPTFSSIMLNLVKCTAKPNKCHVTAIFIALNEYDLTVDSYLRWANRNDCSTWFASSSYYQYAVPVLVLWVRA
jgi:hypothetical protein